MEDKAININTINGDFCLNKYVFNADSRPANDAGAEVICTPADEAEEVVEPQRDEELCHFIHPEIEEEEAWRIHNAVKRLVANQKVPEICSYLKEQKEKGKLLLPSSPKNAYQELVRLGMPTGEGFSEKYFTNNYMK